MAIAWVGDKGIDLEQLKYDAIREAMEKRCSEQGHDYENCCTILFQVYQKCKYCGWQR